MPCSSTSVTPPAASGHSSGPPSELVFTTAYGRPVDASNLRRYFKQACDRAGIGRWTPYEMRHSAASLLSAAGVPLEQIADTLGHEGTRMVTLVYRHAIAPTVEAAAGPMQQLFGAERRRPGRRRGEPNRCLGSPFGSPGHFGPLPQDARQRRKTWSELVETKGLEPSTPCLQSRCSSQLSYVPETASTVALPQSAEALPQVTPPSPPATGAGCAFASAGSLRQGRRRATHGPDRRRQCTSKPVPAVDAPLPSTRLRTSRR